MAVYEMTIRFEAGDDTAALAFAMDAGEAVAGRRVALASAAARHQAAVERVTRVVVTHMPAGGLPC